MGQAAKRKGVRRAVRTAALATAAVQLAEDPVLQGIQATAAADEEAQARWRADAPRQQQRLERAGWYFVAASPVGLGAWQHHDKGIRLLHSVRRENDGLLWAQVSLSRTDHQLPAPGQLQDVHWLLYPSLIGIQVFMPPSQRYAFPELLHIWTCLDRSPVPVFRVTPAL